MTPSRRPSRTRATLFGRVPVLSLLLAVALPALGQDLARGKATLASSLESAALVSGNAVDGNAGTRWASAFSDPQWIQVDLGSVQTLSRVVLNWEGASARDYQVQVSNDGTSWIPVVTRTNLAAGARRDDITGLSGSGRYVRMYGTARTSQWGYSLFDFEVYGGGTGPSLPGRIQAEDYKAGGPGVGFYDVTAANEGGAYRTDAVDIEFTGDVGGGFNVGWTVAGEWLAYDVTVPEAGVFDFTARVASNVAGTKTLRLDVDGVQAGTFDLTTAAGWHTYSDLALNGVGLTAGNHTLRLTMVT
ncbi:MAG TPA: discoidin domain-containing protein, partial [Fibrobacteria bacterium]|nr:discoidin domain-containing protein [Fibrobacteria bacterium]